MSDFSEYLSDYIKQNNMTLKEASLICNQNYSLMSRYTNGNRLPSSISTVIQIAEALQMSEKEKETFFDCYQKEKIGTETWAAFACIENLFKEIDNLFDTKKNLFPQAHYEKAAPITTAILPLSNNQEIQNAILYCLACFSDWETIPVLSLSQPVRKFNELLVSHPLAARINFTGIICIDQNNINSPLTNLTTIHELLPILGSNINYNVFYYYESFPNHINSFSLLPYVIIIGDYALRFDNKFSYGELITIPKLVAFFREQFYHIQQSAKPFTAALNSALEHSMHILNNEYPSGHGIHSWPCIGPYLSQDLYEKFLLPQLPDRELLIENLCQICNYEITKKSTKIIKSFMTKEGMEQFLDTGLIVEFPSQYYTPLPVPVRKLILSRMAEAIENGSTQLYLAKDNFYLPKKVGINVNSLCITLKNTLSPNVDTLHLFETTLCKVFMNYTDYCIENGNVYSLEDTIKYIRSIKI